MSTLFKPKVLIPTWIALALGVFTLFGPPLTPASAFLLLFAACAPPAVMKMLWRPPSATLSQVIAAELHPTGGPGADRSEGTRA